MIHYYHPEMHETISPEIKTHATLAHYGKHYFLKSNLGPDKIRGVGVVYLGQLSATPDLLKMERYIDPKSPLLGYFEYKVTLRAFERLKQEIEIGYAMLLD